MAVQPNLVVGAIGAAIALVSGAYIATNWRDLSGLEDWEASFRTETVRLPTKSYTLPENQRRNEQHTLPTNVTTISVDLTWQDPSFPAGQPEVTLTVLDPAQKVRGTATHRGGVSGMQFDVELVPESEIPSGRHNFTARGAGFARATFEERWPGHPESQGNWTFRVESKTTTPGAAPIYYTLRVEYERYQGTYRPVVTPAVK